MKLPAKKTKAIDFNKKHDGKASKENNENNSTKENEITPNNTLK